MPYPQNIDTAVEVEQIVSQNGALAATIAIINGRIKVGLTREEMRQLASNSHSEVVKCSRRDLPYLIAKKGSGGTTVAATMIIAHMMGIEIFATGGIGGVHRDGHVTFDISADLVELGRTPVTVVSSGIKSILDIPRTLEYLETQG
ncbi:PREDICTED: pseudouridine-5'-phosphate glycosidase, partial [Rhagoletis zephyria]|uniref:pseudouridine-5'-phosphate glycosidase n=1 Tax=Rhagoletis zephyria TaxID=28612 RepID=UPI0008114315